MVTKLIQSPTEFNKSPLTQWSAQGQTHTAYHGLLPATTILALQGLSCCRKIKIDVAHKRPR